MLASVKSVNKDLRSIVNNSVSPPEIRCLHSILLHLSSPSSTDADNSLIEATIESVMNCEFQHFLLMGDFNFPEIDWISCVVNAPGHPAERFLTCVQDLFLCQHVLGATHHRPGQTSNVLDLVLSMCC